MKEQVMTNRNQGGSISNDALVRLLESIAASSYNNFDIVTYGDLYSLFYKLSCNMLHVAGESCTNDVYDPTASQRTPPNYEYLPEDVWKFGYKKSVVNASVVWFDDFFQNVILNDELITFRDGAFELVYKYVARNAHIVMKYLTKGAIKVLAFFLQTLWTYSFYNEDRFSIVNPERIINIHHKSIKETADKIENGILYSSYNSVIVTEDIHHSTLISEIGKLPYKHTVEKNALLYIIGLDAFALISKRGLGYYGIDKERLKSQFPKEYSELMLLVRKSKTNKLIQTHRL